MSNTLLVFPDTTALINFHMCQRIPLLKELTKISGRWTATIQHECERQERELPLPGLAVTAEAAFGEPLFPEAQEHLQIRTRRQLMASPGEHSEKHLGEAEAVVIMEERRMNALFVTDDSHVQKFTHIQCLSSWDLLGHGLRSNVASESCIRSMRSTLLRAGRVHVDEIRRPESFEAWLSKNRP